ncbi:uncharacterized protein CLUP02_01309 [Colletotrichum lupini]|uniref:Uncharacterized protein n=1 Tax=Colletotrichum lupini TaxID=145971 RepID=A0A9Q8SCQ0_9PEZI|nr:uncharacterized protein CLUP02_01309 [Colletotrichum lupini]UQC74658.1 hypothetical protein CLUP02_01309 [Colletotrichum lupini]
MSGAHTSSTTIGHARPVPKCKQVHFAVSNQLGLSCVSPSVRLDVYECKSSVQCLQEHSEPQCMHVVTYDRSAKPHGRAHTSSDDAASRKMQEFPNRKGEIPTCLYGDARDPYSAARGSEDAVIYPKWPYPVFLHTNRLDVKGSFARVSRKEGRPLQPSFPGHKLQMRRQRRRDGVLPKPSPAGVGYAKTTSIRPSYETAGGGLTRMSKESTVLRKNNGAGGVNVRTGKGPGLLEWQHAARLKQRITSTGAHLPLCIDTSLRYFDWWTWDIRVPTGRPSCHVWCWTKFASWNVNLFDSIMFTESTGTSIFVSSLEERALDMRQATFPEDSARRQVHKNMMQRMASDYKQSMGVSFPLLNLRKHERDFRLTPPTTHAHHHSLHQQFLSMVFFCLQGANGGYLVPPTGGGLDGGHDSSDATLSSQWVREHFFSSEGQSATSASAQPERLPTICKEKEDSYKLRLQAPRNAYEEQRGLRSPGTHNIIAFERTWVDMVVARSSRSRGSQAKGHNHQYVIVGVVANHGGRNTTALKDRAP